MISAIYHCSCPPGSAVPHVGALLTMSPIHSTFSGQRDGISKALGAVIDMSRFSVNILNFPLSERYVFLPFYVGSGFPKNKYWCEGTADPEGPCYPETGAMERVIGRWVVDKARSRGSRPVGSKLQPVYVARHRALASRSCREFRHLRPGLHD